MGSTTVCGLSGVGRIPRWCPLRSSVGWLEAVVLGLALTSLVVAYFAHAAYRDRLGIRWSSIYHDRNAHYQAGLCVAAELRNGNFLQAVLDLDAASVAWPGFHPTVLAATLALGGLSPTVAVLPSLFGWAVSVVLAFLIVGRLGDTYAVFGGLFTAGLFLGSPALQALGTDVMLESLGLALTLACVWAYLLYAQTPSRRTGAVLGALLAVLFLHKYNYGGMAVICLAVAETLRRPRALAASLRAAWAAIDWRGWLQAQLVRPLNYLIGVLLGVSAVAALGGGFTLQVGAVRWSVGETRLYVHAAYALLLLRVAVWWWPVGRAAAVRVAGEPAVCLFTWAAMPVELWFLLPFRLHYFLWYAGPGNAPPGLSHSFLEAVRYYGGGWLHDYHVFPELAFAVAALASVGLLSLVRRRDVPTGWGAVPLVLGICGLLTLLHPNQQLRFLHTWAPFLWVAAGLGVAALLGWLARLLGSRAAHAAGLLAVAGLGLVLIYATPAFARVSPGFGRGYDPNDVSLRDLYEEYLSRIDGTGPTGLFTNLPDASWRWAFLERFGHKRGLKHNMRDVAAFDPVDAPGARRWLAATDCRTIVFVEIPRDSPLYEPPVTPSDNSAILRVLQEQTRFTLVHRVPVRNLGTVWVWERVQSE